MDLPTVSVSGILFQATRNEADSLQVQTTKFLFWSIFEAGLAIVVTCLPTLNSLIARVDATAFIRSVRSALSIESLRSRNSPSGSSKGTHYAAHHSASGDGASTSSQIKITASSFRQDLDPEHGLETHVMSNLDRRPDVPEGKIFVRQELEQ